MTEVFLDTAYAIALAAPTDDFHQRALALADYLEENRIDLVTMLPALLPQVMHRMLLRWLDAHQRECPTQHRSNLS